jgi:small subunit ribosomal protein S15
MPRVQDIKEHNAKIVKTHQRTASDTGSPEVQVALITDRINRLNQHFKEFVKDYHSQRGLFKLVGQRRRLLDYLRKSYPARYEKLIKSLELRK